MAEEISWHFMAQNLQCNFDNLSKFKMIDEGSHELQVVKSLFANTRRLGRIATSYLSGVTRQRGGFAELWQASMRPPLLVQQSCSLGLRAVQAEEKLRPHLCLYMTCATVNTNKSDVVCTLCCYICTCHLSEGSLPVQSCMLGPFARSDRYPRESRCSNMLSERAARGRLSGADERGSLPSLRPLLDNGDEATLRFVSS